MKQSVRFGIGVILLAAVLALNAQEDVAEFHDDYYLGFSQGAYYGLMLAGVEYDVAWCVKGELDFEGDKLGAGSEFQANIERIYQACTEGQ